MKVLIAEDDGASRSLLTMLLTGWGYEVVVACRGAEAWEALRGEDPPPVALLEWAMPGMPALAVCERVRELPRPVPTYLILLTARNSREDVARGLTAGADDYITKPFDGEELLARVQVAARMQALQRALAAREAALEEALDRVTWLQGLLPICAYCKKVRGDRNYWHEVTGYVSCHAEMRSSDAICPECWETAAKCELERIQETTRERALARLQRGKEVCGVRPDGPGGVGWRQAA